MILSLRAQSRGYHVPAGTPRIDWGNPITNGLVGVFVGGTRFNLLGANSSFLSDSTTPLSYGGSLGQSWLTSSVGTSSLTFADSSLNLAPQAALMCLFKVGSPASGFAEGNMFCYGSTLGNNDFFVIGTNANPGNYAVTGQTRGDTSTATGQSGVVVLGGSSGVVSGNYGSGASGFMDVYYNGVVQNRSGSVNVGNVSLNRVCVGQRFFSAPDTGTKLCEIGLCAAWNRNLSDAEHFQIGTDPTCFLLYPEDDIFATVVGVAAASSVKFRRTLSQYGTRVGSRQVHFG